MNVYELKFIRKVQRLVEQKAAAVWSWRVAYVSKGRGVSAWSRAARNARAAARVGASDDEREGSEAALLLLLLLLLLLTLSESSSSLPSSSPSPSSSSSPPPSSLSTSSNHCRKTNHHTAQHITRQYSPACWLHLQPPPHPTT